VSIDQLENGTHVVKFFATWCGPCKLYAPAFERVAARHNEANFHSVDIDTDPTMKEAFSVQSVPTTVIVKNGEEIGRLPGAKSTNVLDAFVKGVLSSSDADSA
jgi:thioredoxin